MSRGKNAFRRGNRTLAWYLGDKLLDKVDNDRDATPSPSFNRTSSMDSESSLYSNGRHVNETTIEDKKKRDRKTRSRQRRLSHQQLNNKDRPLRDMSNAITPPSAESSQSHVSVQLNLPADISHDQVIIRQQLAALAAAGQKDRENYWYYDQTSDGFYYEHNGSRGWRKRNPKLHGNPPISANSKVVEDVNWSAEPTPVQQQTVEKKVYVPVPVPVFTPHASKLFSHNAATNLPNIKYYDAATDGYFYEMASVDGWRRRQPAANDVGNPAQMVSRPKQINKGDDVTSMAGFPPLDRNLTNQEVEDLVLSKVESSSGPTNTFNLPLPFASVVSLGLGNNAVNIRTNENDYPSSSSTVSSSASDDITPPPTTKDYHDNSNKEPTIGSFEEPYEFYWSDNEKTDRPTDQVSCVSNVDEGVTNPLTAYFNGMCLNNGARAKRPDSLKIVDPTHAGHNQEKRLPRFNVDQFIADLPGMVDHDNFINNLSSLYTPLSLDSPRTPFGQYNCKDSPLFTPIVSKENAWEKMNAAKRHFDPSNGKMGDHASADLERGLRDIEKIWKSGF